MDNGEAVPLVQEEMDRLLDEIELLDEEFSEGELREGYSPNPEPRRIGCAFYYYFAPKLRNIWNDRRGKHSILV